MMVARAATCNACAAAVVQPVAPEWVFLALIGWSLVLSSVGWVWSQRRFRRFELEQKMEAAFGARSNQPLGP
jgi:hypothetical protein